MSGRTRAAVCSTVTFPAAEQCAFLLGMIRNVIKIIQKVYTLTAPLIVDAKADASVTLDITDDVLLRYLYKAAFNVPYPSGRPTEDELENINAILAILKRPLIT